MKLPKNFYITIRLWKLLKPFHKQFYLQLFFTIITQAATVAYVYLLAQVLNSLTHQNFQRAYTLVFTVLCLQLFKHTVSYFATRHQFKYFDNEIYNYLQKFSFERIFRLNISQYIEDHSDVKIQTINRGEEAIKNILSTIIFSLIPTIMQVTFSVVAISFLSPLIAVIVSVVFLIALVWTSWFSNYLRTFVRINIKNWDEFRKHRTEGMQHLNLIRLNAVENKFLKDYLAYREKIINYHIFTWNKNILNYSMREVYFSLSSIAITLILIYQTSKSIFQLGNLYAIWSWISTIFGNINSLSQVTRNLPIQYTELEKYLEIIDKEPYFKESGEKKFETGDIVFENVSFKYPKAGAPVIENLNIIIPEGKKIAFVGFSGSGKSTVIKLLLRMYDWNEGDIKIGKQNGFGNSLKSLREIDATVLRQKIGYVEQHVDLFDTTIRENILFGIPTESRNKKSNKISNEILNQIVHKARIDQFFHRLGTTGLDTVIGERGVKLSGGERQRIGIARALAKDPDILIFDEATASLDTENEKYIQEAIDESSQGRTTIIIAHRLSTIQNADIIFVMDKGIVVGSGTHEYLKENNPEYQRLIHAQNS